MKNYIDVIYSFEDVEQLRTTIVIDELVNNVLQSEKTMRQFLLQVLDIHFSFRKMFDEIQETPMPYKVSMCVHSGNNFLVLPKWYNEERGKIYFKYETESNNPLITINLN